MTMTIPYGKTHLDLALPPDADVTILQPHATPPAPDAAEAVRAALESVDWARHTGARSAAIAINDKPRPAPHDVLLPPLLEKLHAIGIPRERVIFCIANGSHPPMTPDEYGMILPAAIHSRYRIISHNVDDEEKIIRLGLTRFGSVVSINRAYFEANLKIVVGNVEPHQFAGFSGGVKSAVIGLAGWDTITKNHQMMTHPQAGLGLYDENPVRQDIEDMGRVVGIHLALNVVMNGQKEIVQVFCGTPDRVMRMAIPLVRQVYELPVSAPFDIVIASPGGHPKDLNIYQAQKALGHAVKVSREGGAVILAAACTEGSGSKKYEAFLAALAPQDRTHERVIATFTAQGYRVGPHKAYQIARDSLNRRVIWITDLPDPDFYLMESTLTLREALRRVYPDCGKRIAVIPYANATIPTVQK